ncbi:hypothetical protein ABEB36_011689 [Hypothenemus hampei]|uniref:Kinesin-like protein n=1 Tax=Hypothenemus hampei TaxID=57062 RepID=A0ABD1E8N7_HYPHA
MSANILNEGDSICIKRTNGALQMAVISAIDYDFKCVNVEWLENGETKGKEIYFKNVISLNPSVVIAKSPSTALNKNDQMLLPHRYSKVQSAKSHKQENRDEFSDQLKIEGYTISSARTTRSAVETTLRMKDTKFLTKTNKIEQNRITRRKIQANTRAEKDKYLRQHQQNPHWELSQMVEYYRKQIEFKPLSIQDNIEEHLITVAVRKRPLNKAEIQKKDVDIITIPCKNQIIVHEPKHKLDLTKYLENHIFKFDFALNETCTNEMVYKYTAQRLINTVFRGGFATCFAYGQTGSGKTYTMSGSLNMYSEKGIYALTANDIFNNVHSTQYRHHNFIVSCSFFEIYAKKIFDLLNNKATLKILENGQQQIQIVGMTEKLVTTPDHVLQLIRRGNAERASGQTSANSQSSRSHAIFQFFLRSQKNPKSIYGKFSLIDLAGNERGADTFSSSKQTRLESAEINQSLLSLKECIRALGKKGAHLPFRGSKLTQILRDSFVGAKSKTCMIAMIAPGMSACENTLNTLRYADRVKELGGGDMPIQRFEINSKDSYTRNVPSIREDVKNTPTLLKQNRELVNILQNYLKQAEELLNVTDADEETYHVNMKIVITDAISSLIKMKNFLSYFVVLLYNLKIFKMQDHCKSGIVP